MEPKGFPQELYRSSYPLADLQLPAFPLLGGLVGLPTLGNLVSDLGYGNDTLGSLALRAVSAAQRSTPCWAILAPWTASR
jgi:hypothetical protein